MQTLAPLVDQLIDIAEAELSGGKTCHIRLYDDHTYRIYIEHSYGDGEEAIVYDRDTGEVYWRDTAGARQMYIPDPVQPSTTIITHRFIDDAERVVTTIEPPIECAERSLECTETAALFLANRGTDTPD